MSRAHPNLIASIALAGMLAVLLLGTAPAESRTQQPASGAPPPPRIEAPATQVTGAVLAAAASNVSTAAMALERSSRPEIRSFAQDLLNDSVAVVKLTRDLARKLRIEPSGSDVTTRLARNARRTLEELASTNAREFERDYLAREIGHLQGEIDGLSALLAEGGHDDELEGLLILVRFTMHSHIERARSIEYSLG